MATGDGWVIRLTRERQEAEQLIRYNARNHDAIDRYNELSRILAVLEGDARPPQGVRHGHPDLQVDR